MSKGEETRRQILDQALAFASEVGLERVSIGALAERTNLSKSGLFAHFQSKEALELAIVEHAAGLFVQDVVSPALRAPRGEPRVRALLERWFGWSTAKAMPGGCVFVTSISNAGQLPEVVRERLAATQKDWLEALATAVRIAMKESHFRADLDAAQLAHELLCVAYGHHLLARLLGEQARAERWREATEHLLVNARPKATQPV
ncbi:MAG TPA: TetR/AcrR family transcriptional regulator [Polyangiaceae bacterium]